MGLYLPIDDKLQWLATYATEMPLETWTWETRQKGETPLCFIRQYIPGGSILVCYFEAEMQRARPRLESDLIFNKYFFAPTKEVLKLLGPDMVEAMKEDMALGFPENSVFHEDGFEEHD